MLVQSVKKDGLIRLTLDDGREIEFSLLRVGRDSIRVGWNADKKIKISYPLYGEDKHVTETQTL